MSVGTTRRRFVHAQFVIGCSPYTAINKALQLQYLGLIKHASSSGLFWCFTDTQQLPKHLEGGRGGGRTADNLGNAITQQQQAAKGLADYLATMQVSSGFLC